MLVLRFIVGGILLGIMIVGMIRRFTLSGKVTTHSEVQALRAVMMDARSNIGKDDPRQYSLRVVDQRLLQSELTVPLVLMSAEELRVLAPFIDIRLTAHGTQRDEQNVLTAFKERMVRQNLWPSDTQPHAAARSTIADSA